MVEYFTSSPSLPCTRCGGHGNYTLAKDGTRRPFHYPNFKHGKDRYIATCPKCRGLGRRDCTLEDLRKAYRKLRALVCSERGFEMESFDRLVKKQLGKDPVPAAWYEAARRVAKDLGVES